MRVTAIETIRVDEVPNLIWTRILTDEGVTGLGESFFGPDATEAHIHGVIAPYLLGKDPRRVNEHSEYMLGYLGRIGSGAEQRGRSAVDIALWDIFAKSLGLPLHDVLGGRVRTDLPVYNTCANTNYNVRSARSRSTFDYGVGEATAGYDDTDAFLERPVELAESLLEMGIAGMKIWPFDFLSEDLVSGDISAEGLRKGLAPFEAIRSALGDRMDVMCELHAFWNLPSARRIVHELDQIGVSWIEDPVHLDQMTTLARLDAPHSVRIATGETLGSLGQFKTLIDTGACGLVIYDVSWSGGISGARKVAGMAEAAHLPVAFHDCTGPVVLAASTHLALSTRNCFTQEIARGYYHTWYGDMVSALPPVVNGRIAAVDGPGHGLDLRPELLTRPDVHIKRSES